jgi:hypothetical protein
LLERENAMDITRAVASVATFAALAAALFGNVAPPASAAPSMSGDYVLTETNPAGLSTDTNWNVNPCGEECIDVRAGAGNSRAQLIDGQWVMDMYANIRCPDGVRVPFAANAHVTWDANTQAGTDQQIYLQAACGQPSGYSRTNRIQLKAS